MTGPEDDDVAPYDVPDREALHVLSPDLDFAKTNALMAELIRRNLMEDYRLLIDALDEIQIDGHRGYHGSDHACPCCESISEGGSPSMSGRSAQRQSGTGARRRGQVFARAIRTVRRRLREMDAVF
jgi:hypothetical protein